MRNFSLATVNKSLTRTQPGDVRTRDLSNGDVLKLFVQEPWFSRLCANRSDKEHEGMIILGGRSLSNTSCKRASVSDDRTIRPIQEERDEQTTGRT